MFYSVLSGHTFTPDNSSVGRITGWRAWTTLGRGTRLNSLRIRKSWINRRLTEKTSLQGSGTGRSLQGSGTGRRLAGGSESRASSAANARIIADRDWEEKSGYNKSDSRRSCRSTSDKWRDKCSYLAHEEVVLLLGDTEFSAAISSYYDAGDRDVLTVIILCITAKSQDYEYHVHKTANSQNWWFNGASMLTSNCISETIHISAIRNYAPTAT